MVRTVDAGTPAIGAQSAPNIDGGASRGAPAWTWKVALRAWFYNNFRRHWHNLRYASYCLADPEGRRRALRRRGLGLPFFYPMAAALRREDWEWAVGAFQEAVRSEATITEAGQGNGTTP